MAGGKRRVCVCRIYEGQQLFDCWKAPAFPAAFCFCKRVYDCGIPGFLVARGAAFPYEPRLLVEHDVIFAVFGPDIP
jgi:hypothetical protein